MIDTGGTCAYLSDPDGLLTTTTWPDSVDNPDWAKTSVACHATSDAISIRLGDSSSHIDLVVDTSQLPESVRGLTLVMCQKCEFMMGQKGMNIGGISALMCRIYIDYANRRVGFGLP